LSKYCQKKSSFLCKISLRKGLLKYVIQFNRK
jgi:hypothetical protein